MTTKFLSSLIAKLIDVRAHVHGTDRNKHPKRVLRFQLEGYLTFTVGELLEGFGISSMDGRPYTKLNRLEKDALLALLPSKGIAHAVQILTRIETGMDSFGTIADKAEVLIKAIHPRYAATLETTRLEAVKHAARTALEQRFRVLSGGKALPDGTLTATLEVIVGELRAELEESTRKKMDEVNELALRHPNISRISDINLIAFAARLDQRLTVLHRIRPVSHKPFAAHIAQRMAAI